MNKNNPRDTLRPLFEFDPAEFQGDFVDVIKLATNEKKYLGKKGVINTTLNAFHLGVAKRILRKLRKLEYNAFPYGNYDNVNKTARDLNNYIDFCGGTSEIGCSRVSDTQGD